jgi:hypothetical protein
MFEDYERQKRKQASGMRSVMDYTRGILIILAGVFLMFRDKLNLDFIQSKPPNTFEKIFAVLCFIYGAWRIYRGYKKNYF